MTKALLLADRGLDAARRCRRADRPGPDPGDRRRHWSRSAASSRTTASSASVPRRRGMPRPSENGSSAAEATARLREIVRGGEARPCPRWRARAGRAREDSAFCNWPQLGRCECILKSRGEDVEDHPDPAKAWPFRSSADQRAAHRRRTHGGELALGGGARAGRCRREGRCHEQAARKANARTFQRFAAIATSCALFVLMVAVWWWVIR
ncbi:MAG: hypothetical protein MZV49_07730 [Rhodopseudomonas palustris]|nr:hypothetical protein [Rhodopseudomonas palustris]